jgi:hypothetical protein
MVSMIVLGLLLNLGTTLQVHMNIFKMQSSKSQNPIISNEDDVDLIVL